MEPEKKRKYTSPKAGQSLLTVISAGCKTPVMEVKYSNLVMPFYFPNSPAIPRYSITCTVDPKKEKDFVEGLQAIEKNEKVESIFKNEYTKIENICTNTGKVIIKFQGKETVPIFIIDGDKEIEISLEDELAPGEKISVIYDVLRYTKKNTLKEMEFGLNFKPIKIIFFPSENNPQ